VVASWNGGVMRELFREPWRGVPLQPDREMLLRRGTMRSRIVLQKSVMRRKKRVLVGCEELRGWLYFCWGRS
jgi:hypothetical protein